MAEVRATIGVATRPLPGETANGDGWQVDEAEGFRRIAVIDGLGHGPAAAAATTRALEALASHPNLSPAPALQLCHTALVGTRGAVISIAMIDARQGLLSYAGVGNVEARIWQPDHEERPMIYRGIVGSAMRTVRAFDFPLGDQWLLLMYSDGIRDRFRLEDLLASVGPGPQELADAILAEWSRPTDDATILVAGPAA